MQFELNFVLLLIAINHSEVDDAKVVSDLYIFCTIFLANSFMRPYCFFSNKLEWKMQ